MAGLLAVVSFRRIWAPDFWWQFKTGAYVSQNGPPSVDVFSYTRAGSEWIELRWVFCWMLYRIVDAFGPAGAVVMQWLIMTAAFALAAASAGRRDSPTSLAAFTLVAVLAANQRFQVRPELMTFLLLSAYLLIIGRARAGRRRAAFALPVLQVIWTNAHTLFILGPVLVGLWLVAETADRRFRGRSSQPIALVAGLFALTTLACLVNPYGLRGALFPAQLFTEIHGTIFKEEITEFAGTFSVRRAFATLIHYEILLGLAGVCAILAGRRLDAFWTAAAIALGYLSVAAMRNVPLFCLVAVPFCVHHLGASERLARPVLIRWIPALRRGVCALVIAASGYYAWQFATDRFYFGRSDSQQFGLGLARHRYPAGAAAFLRRHGLEGPLIHTLMEGSYLLARGFRVFVDPRLEVYGEEFFTRYMRIIEDGAAFHEATRAYDFRVAVVDLLSRPVNHMMAGPGWDLVHFDETAAVFVRSDARGGIPAIRTADQFASAAAEIRRRLPRARPFDRLGLFDRAVSPGVFRDVGAFLVAVGQPALAVEFLADARRIQPDSAAILKLHGAALEKAGRTAEAVAAFEEALRLDADDAGLAALLGRQYFIAGELDRARAVLESHPRSSAGWALLANIHYARRNFDEALRCTLEAVRLSPASAELQKNLSKIHAARGDTAAMLEALRTAARLAPADCTVHRELVRILLELGEAASARQSLELGLAACPDSADLRALRQRLETPPG